MRFSVIIPLFNKAPYIKKAIDSVLSQSHKDYEIVVVDDGSRDGSAEVAEGVLKQSTAQYKLIRQANAGVSTARNNGVTESKGDYICFLDADDYWAPTFLEEVSKLINNYPYAGIYGTSYTIVDESRHNTRVAAIGVEPDFYSGYINYCKVYSNGMYMPLWTGAVCIPSFVFNDLGGFKPYLKLGEDFDLWLRIALKYKVAFLNKALAYYNQDVDINNRGVRNGGYDPDTFMTFHFDQFAEEEKNNRDLKVLLDKLRVYSLLRFRLVNEYQDRVRKEIDKVDFANVDRKYKLYYKLPYPIVWFFHRFRIFASALKKPFK